MIVPKILNPVNMEKTLMGQLAPLLQLAVKVFKFSRFHTCMPCQLAQCTKCLDTMETNGKKNTLGGHIKAQR